MKDSCRLIRSSLGVTSNVVLCLLSAKINFKKCQREMSKTEELLSGLVLHPPVSWCLLFEGEDNPYPSFCPIGAGNCHDAATTHCRGMGPPGVRG